MEGPVLAPIQHKPMFVDERKQFGYNPRYAVGPVTFCPDNRLYIWDGVDLITLTGDGTWIGLNVEQVVRRKYGWFTGNVGLMDPHLSFDDDGAAWLAARLTFVKHDTSPDLRQDVFGVLRSTDNCRSWTFYETRRSPPSPHKYYLGPERIERREAHNHFAGPPPMVEARGRELVLTVGKSPPTRERGSHEFERVLVADAPEPLSGKGRNWLTPLHSGAGNVSATYDGKTHMVWQSIQPYEWHKEELDKLSTEIQGPYTLYTIRYRGELGALAPHYIRTYDHATDKLGPRVLLGFSRRDNHDASVISVDSKGYLHVVIGAHHDNFQYTRSLDLSSSTGGWTKPEMFGTPRPPPGEKQTGSYTYTAMVIDPSDTIHLVSRWAGGGYYFNLQPQEAGTALGSEQDLGPSLSLRLLHVAPQTKHRSSRPFILEVRTVPSGADQRAARCLQSALART